MKIGEPTRHRVESALLNRDGSCRDINFTQSISTSGAIGVLEFLASSWNLTQGTSGAGNELTPTELESNLRLPSGSLSTVWNAGNNPEHIQAYFHWLEPDSVFCEITFYPDDFDDETFTLQGFLSVLSRMALAAGSNEYYLRYEDASWRHGQHEKDGVILSSKMLPLS